jgi:hypothetical protein
MIMKKILMLMVMLPFIVGMLWSQNINSLWEEVKGPYGGGDVQLTKASNGILET